MKDLRLSQKFMYYAGVLSASGLCSIDDLKHIQDLIDLEEQGLLVVLPCKVGDVVYLTDSSLKCVHPFEITEIRINKYEWLLRMKYVGTEQQFIHWQIETEISRFGEWFFKSKEEAEAKLKEMAGEP